MVGRRLRIPRNGVQRFALGCAEACTTAKGSQADTVDRGRLCRGTDLALRQDVVRAPFRLVFLLVCVMGMGWSSLALLAEPNVPDMCCSHIGDCADGYRCCSVDVLGVPPCDESRRDVCQPSCVPSGEER